MAGIENLAALASALPQVYAKRLEKQWNRSAVTANLIAAKADAGMGKNVAFDTEFSGATAQTVAEGADVLTSEFNSDVNVPAVLPWAHYRSSFALTETEIDAAASSVGGPDALLDLAADRMLGCGAKIAQLINTDLLTGTGLDGSSNNTLVGLFGGALDATGTYAGLSRATYPEWAGNVVTLSSAQLTVDHLYQLEQAIFVSYGEAPSHIITSPGVFRKYAGLFEQVRRISNDGRGALQYNTGSSELFWKGIPVIRDRSLPAGKLVMFNQNLIKAKYLPRRAPSLDAVTAMMTPAIGSNGDDLQFVTSIPLRVAVLGKTGDSVKFSVKTTLQTCVTRPGGMGYITGISEA